MKEREAGLILNLGSFNGKTKYDKIPSRGSVKMSICQTCGKEKPPQGISWSGSDYCVTNHKKNRHKRPNFGSPVIDILGQPYFLEDLGLKIETPKEDVLSIMVTVKGNPVTGTVIYLKEWYQCTLSDGLLGCGHNKYDYCEHSCHFTIKAKGMV